MRMPILFCSLFLVSVSAQLLPTAARIVAVAVDSNGYIYLAGQTHAGLSQTGGTLHPVPPKDCNLSPPQTPCNFIAKVAPSGDTLIWATYFGGDGADTLSTLAVAADGNIFVAGSTTKAFLPALNGYRTTPGSLFLAKLSSDGKSLLAGTYFGGDAADAVVRLKFDGNGNVYIAGNANSVSFPTTPGAYQTARDTGPSPPGYGLGSVCAGSSDQFLAKFDSSLKTLVFSTLIGTSVNETTGDLALGQDGDLYVAGTRGAAVGEDPCPTQYIMTRLTSNGSTARYSIALPSVLSGRSSVAVDSDGYAYLGGDNSGRDLALPYSSVFKLDSYGAVVATGSVNGWISSLLAGDDGEIVAIGHTDDLPGELPATDGAPRSCDAFSDPRIAAAYVARWNASTMSISYATYLQTQQAWLVGPEEVLATSPFLNFPPFAVVPAGPPLDRTVTCVADAANFVGAAIAPGEILSIFGKQIGPATPVSAQFDVNGNVTSSLGGISVRIGGLPAPLLFAAPDQINLIAPFGISDKSKARIEISRDGAILSAFDYAVEPTKVGLFTSNGLGSGQLAALNQDGSVNSATNMASPGEVVTLFGTGFGAMTPQPVDGSLPPGATSQPVSRVTVSVGDYGQLAEVVYVGNAPTLVQGVVQINLQLPDPIRRLPFSDPNSVTIFVSAGTSRTPISTTIFVR